MSAEPAPSNDELRASWLGTVGYGAALELQRSVLARRKSDEISDSLLLLEHPHVVTLGRRADDSHLVTDRDKLIAADVEIFETDRGGEATYHGPGQLVVYPIVNLRASKLSVVGYVGNLEEVMIRSVSDWGIAAQRKDKNRGIWVGRRKIGSVGVAVRRGVAFHGVSLNVNISLAPFQWMHPCGLKNVETTSMENELAKPLSLKQVRQTVQKHFMQIFNVDMAATDVQHLEHMMGKKP